jgi:hypothetical protein
LGTMITSRQSSYFLSIGTKPFQRDSSMRWFLAYSVPSCLDRMYLKFLFILGPLLTKVRHHLVHLVLQENALISILRLLLFEYIHKFLSKFEMAPIGYRKMPIFRTPPLISDKSRSFTAFLATGKVIDIYKILKLLN